MEESQSSHEKELKEYFDMFDRDKDNLINEKELGNILRSLGHDPTEQDLTEMIKEVDNDSDSKIEFEEFLKIMNNKLKQTETEQELIEAFKIFDKEGKGLISENEFKHIMLSLGEKISEEELEEMMKKADPKNQGYVNYKEFAKILLS
jgi:calmodulin